ncbi:uncharacterized protein OCT59_010924 [Rhizophagus irregularis]|uniref:uncharacterized protein n=1 Tax=Rhizophagus irregularis TaxID=588596 RepID=UPI00332EA8D3|nr:hypothetical protein OCT59_010924 [Rhizophagus irregularis]
MYNLLMGHAEKKMNKNKTSNNIALAANAAWNKLYEYYNKASEKHIILLQSLILAGKLNILRTGKMGKMEMIICIIKMPKKFSGTLNNNLDEDEDSEDSLFPVPKQFRNNKLHRA